MWVKNWIQSLFSKLFWLCHQSWNYQGGYLAHWKYSVKRETLWLLVLMNTLYQILRLDGLDAKPPVCFDFWWELHANYRWQWLVNVRFWVEFASALLSLFFVRRIVQPEVWGTCVLLGEVYITAGSTEDWEQMLSSGNKWGSFKRQTNVTSMSMFFSSVGLLHS